MGKRHDLCMYKHPIHRHLSDANFLVISSCTISIRRFLGLNFYRKQFDKYACVNFVGRFQNRKQYNLNKQIIITIGETRRGAKAVGYEEYAGRVCSAWRWPPHRTVHVHHRHAVGGVQEIRQI